MKSVLLSIQPKWCELIANGEKTIEVRKTAPKLQTPFKCYIYCTNGEMLYDLKNETYLKIGRRYALGESKSNKVEQTVPPFVNRKVIGEFVCDRIDEVQCNNGIQAYYNNREETCLSDFELRLYATVGKPLYFWHISDLKIYDTPKELGEFYPYKGSVWDKCKNQKCHTSNFDCYKCIVMPLTRPPLTRPPQSWCYVEAKVCLRKNF